MRISDWSSDVCSSDLRRIEIRRGCQQRTVDGSRMVARPMRDRDHATAMGNQDHRRGDADQRGIQRRDLRRTAQTFEFAERSEEHTSELQSLMRISYAVFCLKKKKYHNIDSKST